MGCPNRKAGMVEDAQSDPRFPNGRTTEGFNHQNNNLRPLVYRKSSLGVISVLNSRDNLFSTVKISRFWKLRRPGRRSIIRSEATGTTDRAGEVSG